MGGVLAAMKKIDVLVKDIRRVNCFIPECYEHALTVCETTYHRDINKAYAVAWKFDLNEFEEKDQRVRRLGDCLHTRYTLFSDIERFCGVKIRKKDVFSTRELLDVIERNLDNSYPTLFHLDTYYCEWGMLYLKAHTNHVGIATGIDRENDKLWIVDPDYSDEAFSIDVRLLSQASRFYFDICVEDSVKYSYSELLDYIRKEKDAYEKIFYRIELFAKYFKEYFAPQIEFAEPQNIDCVLDSLLILRLREVIKARNMFIIFLEQIEVEYPCVKKAIEYLSISMGKWNTIMNSIFKASRTRWREDFNEKVYNIVMSIVEIERMAYDVLFCSKREQRIKEEDKSLVYNSANRKTIKIDIQRQCNNKGFVYSDRDQSADLTAAGEYFVLNEIRNHIMYQGIDFQLYFDKPQDNIICKGQKIRINFQDAIKGIALLLCAEWGTCEDAVTIVYKDGVSDMHKIIANDISQTDGEDVIQLGHSVMRNGDVVNERTGITFQIIKFREKQYVESLVLPDNLSVHILSLVAIV